MANKGEFGLIEPIKGLFEVPAGVMGIGDDCAVIPMGQEDIVVTTDMLVEGVHFLCSDATPEQVGYKAAAVNLSDIAAMGASPVGAFLSLALPKEAQGEWAERMVDGLAEACRAYDVPLLGGDTTSSLRDICINVAVVGRVPHGADLLRGGAQVGDVVYVTGPLGDSGGGLKVILSGEARSDDAKHLVERHYHPSPRLAEGVALASLHAHAHAMMDISDGIASDLGHILKASGVGAEVELDVLPLSEELVGECSRRGWSATEIAASAGEDFELLVTGSCDLPSLVDFPLYPIGRIVAGDHIVWLSQGREVAFDKQGYKHF